MSGAGRHSPEPGGPRYGEGAWLIALRGFWSSRYVISVRRRWFRREWLAARKDGSGDPIRSRDRAAFSKAVYADWLAVTALEAHKRIAAEQAPAGPPAAFDPVPPPVFPEFISDEGWPDDGMTTMCDPGGPVRMNRRYASRDQDAS